MLYRIGFTLESTDKNFNLFGQTAQHQLNQNLWHLDPCDLNVHLVLRTTDL